MNIVKDVPSADTSIKPKYKSLHELPKRSVKLKLAECISESESNVIFTNIEPEFHVPKYELTSDHWVGFKMTVYGFILREDLGLCKRT